MGQGEILRLQIVGVDGAQQGRDGLDVQEDKAIEDGDRRCRWGGQRRLRHAGHCRREAVSETSRCTARTWRERMGEFAKDGGQ